MHKLSVGVIIMSQCHNHCFTNESVAHINTREAKARPFDVLHHPSNNNYSNLVSCTPRAKSSAIITMLSSPTSTVIQICLTIIVLATHRSGSTFDARAPKGSAQSSRH